MIVVDLISTDVTTPELNFESTVGASVIANAQTTYTSF